MRSMGEYIKTSDLRLLGIFNQSMHCQFLDWLMSAVTQLGSVGFAVTLPAILILSGNTLMVSAGIKMMWVLVCGLTVVLLVKRLAHRPRPFKVLAGVINNKPTSCPYSLPSGHTCSAFSQAFVLAASFPEQGFIFLMLAALVGISRVYLGVHYPSDVGAGGLTAYAVFLLCSCCFF